MIVNGNIVLKEAALQEDFEENNKKVTYYLSPSKIQYAFKRSDWWMLVISNDLAIATKEFPRDFIAETDINMTCGEMEKIIKEQCTTHFL